MSTKMKGLFKGLRYISQMFDEEKEHEMEIGLPTDVKHVAHIGWDGPSFESPSWMKEFKSPTSFQSAPLGMPGEQKQKENPEIKWVSEDGKSGRAKNGGAAVAKDAEGGKPSRRQTNNNNAENSTESPKKERRHSKKNHSKDSSDSVKSNRQLQDLGSDSPSRPDIPKKTRRKKSKESVNGGGSSGSVKSRMRSGDTTGTSEAGSTHSQHHKSKKKDGLKSDLEEEDKVIGGIF